jgi:hypothetical protein
LVFGGRKNAIGHQNVLSQLPRESFKAFAFSKPGNCDGWYLIMPLPEYCSDLLEKNMVRNNLPIPLLILQVSMIRFEK